MKGKDGLPVHHFRSVAAWRSWLAKNQDSAPGLWLKMGKKDAGTRTVTYSEALDVALAHGWIDSHKMPLDAAFWLQRFTPRRARSKWSRINCDRAETLIKAGQMTPAGLAQVEDAKADGRWDRAYASRRSAEVPRDLQAQLDADPKLRDLFAALGSADRYAILYRLEEARRPETRARRLAAFVAMLNEGRTPHGDSPRPRRAKQ